MSGVGAKARRLALAGAIVIALGATAEAAAKPLVHAHRGGSLVTTRGEQRPVFGEETMPAFRDSSERGFVLELDAKLSSDGVPLVIHDATLDRTTVCEGEVSARTAAEIRRECPVDLLGTADVTAPLPKKAKRPRVPLVRQVLRLAARRGVGVNLEVKNVPTDPDFDSTSGFARAVADEVRSSGFPPSRLIVQSFWPPDLDFFESDPYFEQAETSLLTLGDLNDGGPMLADANGYEWVSPEWPVSESYVQDAHARGLRVVPYTLNAPADVIAATETGVDAVISDDPRMARRAVRRAASP